MRLDYLIDRLIESVARERTLLRRTSRYILPLLLLPIGFALAQATRGWSGLVIGGLAALVLLAQVELFLRPTLARTRVTDRDVTYYLGLTPESGAPSLAPAVALLAPAALTLALSMAVFLPTLLASARSWQRLLALALGLGALWAIWQRLAQCATLLDSLEGRLTVARRNLPTTDHRLPTTDHRGGEGERGRTENHRPPTAEDGGWKIEDGGSMPGEGPSSILHPPSSMDDGLLDPLIARRVAGMPLPPLLLSPAAQALLRVEAYLQLRDFPETSERALLDGLAGLAHEAHQAELAHWLLPPVGGKLYLPLAAQGTLAGLLGTTARRLGMDGGYSATLGTWLVRLPPARSYAVAGRLLDALVALRLPPPGAILPHHLTVQGDLGQESKVLSLVHLAATPLVFAERPGHAQGDERPFIMRGGGVLDDMGGRGRLAGQRTDFVDGFVFVDTPGLAGAEHLTSHTINLRVKQVLAFGLLAAARPHDRRSPVDRRAAAAYTRLRADLRTLLDRYGLRDALDIRWLDGLWSEVWPHILRMSELKERDTGFLDAAQRLRDAALGEIEGLAVEATRGSARLY